MRAVPLFFLLLLCSCSFSYRDVPEGGTVQPDMVFENVTLKRYSNALLDLNVYANRLEMYDEEKIWAGKNILFTHYDEKTQKESMKGKTGILYIDEKLEEYSLGETVFFHLIEDDFSIRSPALIWKKKEHLLAAPAEAAVTITQKDEIEIEGKSFAAHTSSKEFVFAQGTSGTIIITEKNEEPESAASN